MAKTKLTLTIEDGVIDLLHKAAGERGVSDYITDLVDERWRDWQDGLEHLRTVGWADAELLAACDALNGKLISARHDLGPQLAATMEDAAIIDGIAKKYNVGDRWRDRCGEVRASDAVARSLLIVVREWWTGNDVIRRAIDTGDNQ